jgi:hypothetical protein
MQESEDTIKDGDKRGAMATANEGFKPAAEGGDVGYFLRKNPYLINNLISGIRGIPLVLFFLFKSNRYLVLILS